MNYNFEVCGFEVDIEYTPGSKGYLSGPPENCYPAEYPSIELNSAIPIDKAEFEDSTGFPYAFAQIWRELFPEEFEEQIELAIENIQISAWLDWRLSSME